MGSNGGFGKLGFHIQDGRFFPAENIIGGPRWISVLARVLGGKSQFFTLPVRTFHGLNNFAFGFFGVFPQGFGGPIKRESGVDHGGVFPPTGVGVKFWGKEENSPGPEVEEISPRGSQLWPREILWGAPHTF